MGRGRDKGRWRWDGGGGARRWWDREGEVGRKRGEGRGSIPRGWVDTPSNAV